MTLSRAVRHVVLGGMGLLLLAAIGISVAGMADDLRPTDVGVVLGSKVELNGQPSRRLAARLERGASLYAQGVFPRVIVSGGTGSEGFDEALVMRDYLVARGVPLAAIIVDSGGVTTQATARNCASLMARNGFKSVTVVTQYFHVPRTRMALRRHGIGAIGSAHARFFELRDVYSIAREVAALPAYWLSPHLSSRSDIGKSSG
ncbi:MAG: YdcF family protein [Telluria sp.]